MQVLPGIHDLAVWTYKAFTTDQDACISCKYIEIGYSRSAHYIITCALPERQWFSITITTIACEYYKEYVPTIEGRKLLICEE